MILFLLASCNFLLLYSMNKPLSIDSKTTKSINKKIIKQFDKDLGSKKSYVKKEGKWGYKVSQFILGPYLQHNSLKFFLAFELKPIEQMNFKPINETYQSILKKAIDKEPNLSSELKIAVYNHYLETFEQHLSKIKN